jgi:biotin carboxylase
VDERAPRVAARRRAAGWLRQAPDAEPDEVAQAVLARLGDARPRLVVSVGERGVRAAAALRAALGLPGLQPQQALRVRDKPAMKAAVRAAGVPCTDWRELTGDVGAAALIDALGLPLVFKHRAGAGSRDLTVARDVAGARAFLRGLPTAERGDWMAERYVQGVEMSLESFLLGGGVAFVNPTEYLVPAFANIAPAALPPEERQAALELNRRALAALGLERGMTHLELYRTAQGPLFGEVAARPPGGRIMRLLRRAYGFDPWEALLAVEEGRPYPFPEHAQRSAGVWLLHPGPGRVRHVRGLAAARRVRGVRKLVCRVRAGCEVAPRPGTGADVGWIEVHGADRDEVARRLGAAHDLVHIDLGTEPEAPAAPRRRPRAPPGGAR